MDTNSLRRGFSAILDNVEVKAKASSAFTEETVNKRLNTLRDTLLSISLGLESATKTYSTEQEINYLQDLKQRKGW